MVIRLDDEEGSTTKESENNEPFQITVTTLQMFCSRSSSAALFSRRRESAKIPTHQNWKIIKKTTTDCGNKQQE
jgi:hypothetical protein